MLSGEPGIGKTTIARAFAELADGEGFRVLWGTCYEAESSAPFGPWVQALAPALRTVDLDARFGPSGTVLAELVPTVGEVVSHARRPVPLASGEARLRAYEAFAEVLIALADERVVVVLDDLHWADAASLGLLGLPRPLRSRRTGRPRWGVSRGGARAHSSTRPDAGRPRPTGADPARPARRPRCGRGPGSARRRSQTAPYLGNSPRR